MDLPADLLTLEEVGSTNDVARELAEKGAAHGAAMPGSPRGATSIFPSCCGPT